MQSNRSGVPQSHRFTVEQLDRSIPARGKWTRSVFPPMPEPGPIQRYTHHATAPAMTRPSRSRTVPQWVRKRCSPLLSVP